MNTRLKRNIAVVCSIVLAASMMIGGTLAYFSDSMTVTNNFTMGGVEGSGNEDNTGVDVEVTEPSYEPETSKDMAPGTVIAKDPTVTNVKGESYVRFIVTLKDKTTQEPIADEARANKILSTLFYDPQDQIKLTKDSTVDGSYTKYTLEEAAALSGVLTPFNTTDFEKDADRGGTGVYYYNYKGTLQKGETAVLFSKVVIPKDWNQDDLNAVGNYDLVVTAQAIQAQNMKDANEAFDALDGEVAQSSTLSSTMTVENG